eukprot:Selendium_serpulae@DN2235_c0_g1_i1.p1
MKVRNFTDTPEDNSFAIKVLTDAFADDPITLWTSQNPKVNEVAQELLVTHYAKKGVCQLVDSPGGATLWSTPRLQEEEMKITLGMGFRLWWAGGFGFLRKVRVLMNCLESNHAALKLEPHYYLIQIGVESNARGKGVGGCLMRSMLEQIDLENVGVYLENSKPIDNTPFYERHGFESIKEVRVGNDGPPLLLMWRPKASDRAAAGGGEVTMGDPSMGG